MYSGVCEGLVLLASPKIMLISVDECYRIYDGGLWVGSAKSILIWSLFGCVSPAVYNRDQGGVGWGVWLTGA